MIATLAMLARQQWRWERCADNSGCYELLRGEEIVGLLSLPTPYAALVAAELNAERAVCWAPVMYGEQPTLALSGAVDVRDTALAYLTPLDEECWQMIAGAELPPLEDGPVRLTLPPVPTEIPPRPRT